LTNSRRDSETLLPGWQLHPLFMVCSYSDRTISAFCPYSSRDCSFT
jgi:hypothetical protein